MDIVKAFSSNDFHAEINIQGDYENPLFRASDIGSVLDIKQIRNTMKNFGDDYKVAHTINTVEALNKLHFY